MRRVRCDAVSGFFKWLQMDAWARRLRDNGIHWHRHKQHNDDVVHSGLLGLVVAIVKQFYLCTFKYKNITYIDRSIRSWSPLLITSLSLLFISFITISVIIMVHLYTHAHDTATYGIVVDALVIHYCDYMSMVLADLFLIFK